MQLSTIFPAQVITDLRHASSDVSHVKFEYWADQYPGATAVLSGESTFTYAEIEQRANQIAHALRAGGVKRGDVVAVFLERDVHLVCALLGVLKSGAAFAALDPRSPREALTRIFDAVACPVVLTRRDLASSLPVVASHLFFLDDAAWLGSQPTFRPLPLVREDDPACVLFTSGSSGKPKAVLYLHRNLSVRFSNSSQVSAFDRRGVFSQSSPVTSIDAIDEILVPLVNGGSTVILPYSTVTSPHQLIAALSLHRVTHILLVPSLLRVLLAAEENLSATLTALKTWMVGGEPLTGSLAREFYRKLPGAVLINFYGLTEGDASFHVVSPDEAYEANVPVGRAVQNTQVYLLDEQLKPVTDGRVGEIYLSGAGLFHKYLNRPELNAERWIPNPFVTDRFPPRLFRTGDLGRYRLDGEIEYLGRSDRMVKVRGFRVELGEVESVLSRHAAVEQCVAIARQPEGNGALLLQHQTYIVAYVVLKTGVHSDAQELREFLMGRLPDYAVPSLIVILDSFPLSPNGKVDTYALSQMNGTDRTICKNYVAPRNAIEFKLARIWEDLLKFRPIGVQDSFFEIGGDSLAAIDLMLTLEKEFQRNLPITVLFESPTIAALAELLQGDAKSVSMASLVPIRVQGSRPPLFCVHADGSVFIYRRFVDYLDPEIPIFGLQAHGLANPRHQPYKQVDEMAAHYIREIRSVQPHGPYHLCAFSAGGLIIFEMARQFQEQGEAVAFLGLLDAYGPDYPHYLPSKNLADYKISVHVNTLRLYGFKGQWKYLMGRMRHRANIISSRLFAALFLKLRLPMPPKIRYEYIAKLIDQAAQIYPSGRSYAGDAVLFHAMTQPEGIKQDPTLGWSELVAGDLRIVNVIGTHNSIMMHEPHVADLVREIDQQLGQLHRKVTPGVPQTESFSLRDSALLSLR